MENFESAKASKERANEGGGVCEYTRVSSAYTQTCLFLRIFARTLNIVIKKSYYNFVSLTLSLSHSHLFSTTWTSFSSRDHPRFLCIRLLLSLSLSLSYTHSLVHLLNKLPPLSPCLHLINTKNVYSTPSILSSTSMYNCRKRSMFSSLVSQ